MVRGFVCSSNSDRGVAGEDVCQARLGGDVEVGWVDQPIASDLRRGSAARNLLRPWSSHRSRPVHQPMVFGATRCRGCNTLFGSNWSPGVDELPTGSTGGVGSSHVGDVDSMNGKSNKPVHLTSASGRR